MIWLAAFQVPLKVDGRFDGLSLGENIMLGLFKFKINMPEF